MFQMKLGTSGNMIYDFSLSAWQAHSSYQTLRELLSAARLLLRCVTGSSLAQPVAQVHQQLHQRCTPGLTLIVPNGIMRDRNTGIVLSREAPPRSYDSEGPGDSDASDSHH
jgi:hypothetical protein